MDRGLSLVQMCLPLTASECTWESIYVQQRWGHAIMLRLTPLLFVKCLKFSTVHGCLRQFYCSFVVIPVRKKLFILLMKFGHYRISPTTQQSLFKSKLCRMNWVFCYLFLLLLFFFLNESTVWSEDLWFNHCERNYLKVKGDATDVLQPLFSILSSNWSRNVWNSLIHFVAAAVCPEYNVE